MWSGGLTPLCLVPFPVEKQKSHLEVPLEENINRQLLEEGAVEARTIEEAIAVLRYAEGASTVPSAVSCSSVCPPPLPRVRVP